MSNVFYSYLIEEIEYFSKIIKEDQDLSIADVDKILRIASGFSKGDASTDQRLDGYQPPEISDDEKSEIRARLEDRIRRSKYTELSKRIASGDTSAVLSINQKMAELLSALRSKFGAGTNAYQFANKIASNAKKNEEFLAAAYSLLSFALMKVQQESVSDKTIYILYLASEITDEQLTEAVKKTDYNNPENRKLVLRLYKKRHGLNRDPKAVQKFLDKEIDLEDPGAIRSIKAEILSTLKSEGEKKLEQMYSEWQKFAADKPQSPSLLFSFLRRKGYSDSAINHAIDSEKSGSLSVADKTRDLDGSDLGKNKKIVFTKAAEVVDTLSDKEKKLLKRELIKAFKEYTATGVSDGQG